MKISELTKIEANIGFLIGVTTSVVASWVFVVFFTTMQWYFKAFSSLGQFSIMGMLIFQLVETFKIRKNYLEVLKEMEKVNKEANTTINDAITELKKEDIDSTKLISGEALKEEKHE